MKVCEFAGAPRAEFSGLFVTGGERPGSVVNHGERPEENNAFQRSLHRLVGFNMGRTVDDQTLAVRRVMPALHTGQVRRLPNRLQRLHQEAIARREADREEDTHRATKVAFTLLQLGDSPDLVEQQLVSWGVEPATSHDAVNQAWAAKARSDRAASIPAA